MTLTTGVSLPFPGSQQPQQKGNGAGAPTIRDGGSFDLWQHFKRDGWHRILRALVGVFHVGGMRPNRDPRRRGNSVVYAPRFALRDAPDFRIVDEKLDVGVEAVGDSDAFPDSSLVAPLPIIERVNRNGLSVSDQRKRGRQCEQIVRFHSPTKPRTGKFVNGKIRPGILLCGVLLLTPCLVPGATYYVRTDGNDGNSGAANTSGGAFLTIGKAETSMQAGDTVYVQAGTYNERVAVSGVDGTSEAWINYVAVGQVVCRGFDLTGIDYTRIIGFEVTHATTDYSHGIVLNTACTHVDLVDNYIHEIKGQAIRTDTSGHTHLTVRGNRVYWTDYIPDVYTNFSAYGIGGGQGGGNSVYEYNTVQRAADVFILSAGTNAIVRNNYCWDFQNSYWNGDDSVHSDIFQDGSDGQQTYSRHHIYENNFTGDCTEINSHFGIWQDTGFGDTNILIRGNVGYNFGSGGVGTFGVDKVQCYQNSFYDTDWAFTFYNGGGVNQPGTLGLIANNALHTAVGITIENAEANAVFNLGYTSGSHTSYVSTADPLFVDAVNRNFRLQAGSPARDAGTNVVWITSADASGTSFNVNDGQRLCDGWGMVDGDTITTGGTTTKVTGISGNTVTVASSVTWTNLQPVYWGTDTTPDIGALPYGSTALTSATLTTNGTTYTVTPAGDCRMVVFYVDGIPQAPDYTSPYTLTSSGGVTAKAYAMYAQATPVVTAGGGEPEPPPPASGSGGTIRGNVLRVGRILKR